MNRGRRDALLGLLGLLAVVVVLEILPRSGLVNRDYLPPASEMASTLWDQLGTRAFWTATGQTCGVGSSVCCWRWRSG